MDHFVIVSQKFRPSSEVIILFLIEKVLFVLLVQCSTWGGHRPIVAVGRRKNTKIHCSTLYVGKYCYALLNEAGRGDS